MGESLMNLRLTSQQIIWHNQTIMNLRSLEMDETAGRVQMSSGRAPRQDLIETLNEVQRTTEAKHHPIQCAAAGGFAKLCEEPQVFGTGVLGNNKPLKAH